MTATEVTTSGVPFKAAFAAKRLTFLDWIRGIAALSVVIQHAAEKLWPSFWSWSHQYFNLGKFGVAIFFLTSGFVIPLTLERGKSLSAFWINRFYRLFPLYWASLLMVLGLLALGFHAISTPEFQANLWRNTLVNLTMCQEFARVPHALGLYYTLTLELAFYVLFSLLFFRKLHKLTALYAWTAIVGQSLITVALPLMLHRRMPMAEIFFFSSLFIGTSLFRYAEGEMSMRVLSSLIGTITAVTTAGVILNYVTYKKTNMEEHFSFAAVFVPWLLAYSIFIVSYRARDAHYPAVFSWLGQISYSMYLLHPILLVIAITWKNQLASFFFTVLGTVAVSHLTFLYIEKPFISHGKRITKARQSRQLPSDAAIHDVPGFGASKLLRKA